MMNGTEPMPNPQTELPNNDVGDGWDEMMNDNTANPQTELPRNDPDGMEDLQDLPYDYTPNNIPGN